MENYCWKKRYIVQQRIPLAKIDECPFDIRVMVQRKKNSPIWVVTGKLAKVAAKRFVITNYPQEILQLETAMLRSSFDKPTDDILSIIDQVCLQTAEHIGNYYKDFRLMGLDIGLDSDANVWIIEANLSPSLTPFKSLEDKTMYNNILRHIRGRA
jgi:hypothetical protein